MGSRNGRVLIVGGGASGVLLAAQILGRDERTTVALIEKRPSIGRGIAYSTATRDHLLNVRTHNMSAFPDDPDHFRRWLQSRRPEPSAGGSAPDYSDPSGFVPRHLYGDYIASLVEPYLAAAGSQRLKIIRDECVALAEGADGVTASLKDGGTLSADVAVLATGHSEVGHRLRCYVDPWTPPPEAGVDADAPILIIGTGLTMVDYVIALQLAKHRGPIFAMSRRGLLPHVHRKVETFKFDAGDIPLGQSAAKLMRWLRGEARRRVAAGGDWREVVDGIRPYTQSLWQSLTLRDRDRFLEHARAWWDVHRHRMAPAAAARINEAIGTGQLNVIAAKVVGIEEQPTGARVRYRRRGAQTVDVVDVAKVVECRVASDVAAAADNPLLRALFEAGTVRSDPLRIGLDVTTDCRVISRAGAPSQRIFAAGPLTRSAFWEIVAIPDIRNQCAVLAATVGRQAMQAR